MDLRQDDGNYLKVFIPATCYNEPCGYMYGYSDRIAATYYIIELRQYLAERPSQNINENGLSQDTLRFQYLGVWMKEPSADSEEPPNAAQVNGVLRRNSSSHLFISRDESDKISADVDGKPFSDLNLLIYDKQKIHSCLGSWNIERFTQLSSFSSEIYSYHDSDVCSYRLSEDRNDDGFNNRVESITQHTRTLYSVLLKHYRPKPKSRHKHSETGNAGGSTNTGLASTLNVFLAFHLFLFKILSLSSVGTIVTLKARLLFEIFKLTAKSDVKTSRSSSLVANMSLSFLADMLMGTGAYLMYISFVTLDSTDNTSWENFAIQVINQIGQEVMFN